MSLLAFELPSAEAAAAFGLSAAGFSFLSAGFFSFSFLSLAGPFFAASAAGASVELEPLTAAVAPAEAAAAGGSLAVADCNAEGTGIWSTTTREHEPKTVVARR